jgi:hypothetical protein
MSASGNMARPIVLWVHLLVKLFVGRAYVAAEFRVHLRGAEAIPQLPLRGLRNRHPAIGSTSPKGAAVVRKACSRFH